MATMNWTVIGSIGARQELLRWRRGSSLPSWNEPCENRAAVSSWTQRGAATRRHARTVCQRTSIELRPSYDSAAVADVLDRDMAEHGAPLVCRMDRASVHRTAGVLEVLRSRQVLLLHGPPHHAQYYGQLERQNREHRA